jgi:hypothetical protein
MGGDCVARIDKLENGYTVEVVDEDVRAKNNDPKNKGWEDPWKSYAFSTAEEVTAFLTAHLDKLKPPPDANEEFSSSFAKAAASDD